MTALARIGTKHRPEPPRQDAPSPAVRAVRVETRTERITVGRVTYRPAVEVKISDLADAIRSIEPEAFAAQMPFYATKPAYPALLWLLSKGGINPVDAAAYTTQLAYGCLAILLFCWLVLFVRPLLAGALTLAILANPAPVAMVTSLTPDALSACVVVLAFYLMSRRRVGAALATAVVGILIRPDTFLLVLLMAGWAALHGGRLAAAGAVISGTAVFLAISMWAGAYPWTTFFYHSFVERLPDPAGFVSPLSVGDYAAIYLQMAALTLQHNFAFVGFLVLALSGLLARYQRAGWRDPYFAALAVCALYAVGFWIVMPWAEDRYLAPYYIVILVALVRNLAEAFAARGQEPGDLAKAAPGRADGR